MKASLPFKYIIAEKKGKNYVVFDFKDDSGKRKRKWVTTDLPVDCSYKALTAKVNVIVAKFYEEFLTGSLTKVKETPKEKTELSEEVLSDDAVCKTSFEFTAFLDYWLETIRPTIARTSYESYNRYITRIKNYFDERYPHLLLGNLTALQLQQFYNDKFNSGLSGNSVKHYHANIHKALKYAVKMDMLTDNPCNRVTVPKGEKKEKDIYTLEEVAQLFQLLETAPLKYRTFFTLAIYSGFRRGEMLGLEWKDIDWEHNVISVRRTSNYTASKGIYTDTTKTKKSQRSLKFPQSVMDLLREYKAEQDEEREKLDTKWQDYDRLFVKWDGRPMNNNTPYFWLKEFCEENNFRFCDIHSLRHFYASALINEGVDAATVSGALGHSTITTTTSIYCHVFNQAQARASEAIASVLDFKKSDNGNDAKGQSEAV